MNIKKQKSMVVAGSIHHRWRTFFAAFFGFVGLNLVILSIVALWLGATMTSTDRYVKTVAPLVTDKTVTAYVADKISEALIEQARTATPVAQTEALTEADPAIRELAARLLPAGDYEGKTTDQLLVLIEPVINDSVFSVLESEGLLRLWTETNRTLHAQFIYSLENAEADVVMDFHPVIDTVMTELQKTRFADLASQVEIPSDAGVVTVESSKLETVRRIYNTSKLAIALMLVAAVVSVILAITISVNHTQTMRRILVATGIVSILFAVSLSAVALFPSATASRAEADLTKAIVGILFGDLRDTFLLIAVICLVTALISKIISIFYAHKITTASS